MLKLIKQPQNKTPIPRRLIIAMIAIVICAIVVRFINWTIAPTRSLLTSAPGLTHFSTVEDAAVYLDVALPTPTQTFDATPFSVGIYSQQNNAFPTNTVAVAYVKNSRRVFEVDYIPERRLEEQKQILQPLKIDEVKLDDKDDVLISKNDSPRCIEYNDGLPDKCEISSQIYFELGEFLICISSDGDNTTQGELVEIAKSFAVEKSTK